MKEKNLSNWLLACHNYSEGWSAFKPSATYTDRACPSYHPPPPAFYPFLMTVCWRGGNTTRVESLPQEHNTVTSLGIDSRPLILPSSAQWQSRYLFRILDSQLPEMMFKVGLFSFSGFTVLISTLQIWWFPSKIQCLLKEKIEGGVIVD